MAAAKDIFGVRYVVGYRDAVGLSGAVGVRHLVDGLESRNSPFVEKDDSLDPIIDTISNLDSPRIMFNLPQLFLNHFIDSILNEGSHRKALLVIS